jgi:hypothetical protein
VDDDGISRAELEVERKKWILRFFEVVQQDTYARDALDFLVTGGMAREHVASVLFWYTDPVSAYYQSRISTLAKRHVPMLETIQKELWACQLALGQDDEDRMTAPSSWPVAQIDGVAEVYAPQAAATYPRALQLSELRWRGPEEAASQGSTSGDRLREAGIGYLRPSPRKGKNRDAHSVPVEQKSRRSLLFNEIDATP